MLDAIKTLLKSSGQGLLPSDSQRPLLQLAQLLLWWPCELEVSEERWVYLVSGGVRGGWAPACNGAAVAAAGWLHGSGASKEGGGWRQPRRCADEELCCRGSS